MEVKLSLPFPPSINRLWRIGKGNWYCTSEYTQFKDYVCMLTRIHKTPKFDDSARLSVEVYLHPPNKRSLDVDNFCKAVFDSLQDSGVIPNDSQVDELWVERKEIVKNGRCEVVIRTIEGTTNV